VDLGVKNLNRMTAEPHGLSAASERDEIARMLAKLVLGAGPAVMNAYRQGCEIWAKADHSPCSEADERAETLLLNGIARNFPGIPVIAEEAVSRGEIPHFSDHFLLVDPLDGTREFIARNNEFTINIALIIGSEPVAGAVYAPALKKLWFAGSRAFACPLRSNRHLPALENCLPIHTRTAPSSGLVAMASRSHGDVQTDAFLCRLPVKERVVAGSSLKFCVLAEGCADVYARYSPTMEWDTAAGDAILRAAGGQMSAWQGGPFRYGKSGFRNAGFIAWGDPERAIIGRPETVY
jgi:3'(2'), 5'-bisphosphate nucleotidase